MNDFFLIMPLWLCAMLSWCMGLYILSQRKFPEFTYFALTLISIGIYAGSYGGELYSGSIREMLFWSKLEYVGIITIPLFWVQFVCAYIGKRDLLHTSVKILLWGIPIATIVFKIFDERFGLVYRSVSLDETFNTLRIVPGPWYYVTQGYSYAFGLGGAIALAMFGMKRMGLHRRNAIALAMVTLLPVIANILYHFPNSPLGSLDLYPFSLVVAILILYFAILKNDLMTLAPVAKEFIVDHLPQGILVFDNHRRLCEANESARALLALGREFIGEDAAVVLTPFYAERALPDSGRTQFDITINGRELEVQTCILNNEGNNERIGWIVTLIDISERKRMEARLEQMLRTRGDSTKS
jgi:PAS domain-containing protein